MKVLQCHSGVVQQSYHGKGHQIRHYKWGLRPWIKHFLSYPVVLKKKTDCKNGLVLAILGQHCPKLPRNGHITKSTFSETRLLPWDGFGDHWATIWVLKHPWRPTHIVAARPM